MVVFEVERKFNYTLSSLHRLQKALHHPRSSRPRLKLECCGRNTFRDTYFDLHQKLSKNGLWVRKRCVPFESDKWEAKQRRDADDSTFDRTTFEEMEDVDQIQRMVRRHIPTAPDWTQDFGLDPFAGFTTRRLSYKVPKEKFNVVLDKTDFGHRIGEVEVMAEDAGEAHAEIGAFMGRYPWFFDTSVKPTGKLTAYFEKFGYPIEKSSTTSRSRFLQSSLDALVGS